MFLVISIKRDPSFPRRREIQSLETRDSLQKESMKPDSHVRAE